MEHKTEHELIILAKEYTELEGLSEEDVNNV
jgi:hypothetical protein